MLIKLSVEVILNPFPEDFFLKEQFLNSADYATFQSVFNILATLS